MCRMRGSYGVQMRASAATATNTAVMRAPAPRLAPLRGSPHVSPRPQSGIDQHVAQIDQEAHHHHREHQHHDHALYDDQVALHDRLKYQPAQSRKKEDVFDDHAAGEQKGKLHAEDGQHRHHGVGQRVLDEHPPLADALGARAADVVLMQRVDERAAQHPGQNGSLRHGERDGRQGERFQGRPESRLPTGKSTGGHPTQRDRKYQHQQHSQPEVRHRETQLGYGADD